LVGLGIPDPETGADPAAFDRHALRPRIWMLDRARLGCIALPYTHFGVLMTRRIYHEDPEARTFLARVESCRPGPEGTVDVVLNRTAFYPTGGGQPHDSGVLAGFPVVVSLNARARSFTGFGEARFREKWKGGWTGSAGSITGSSTPVNTS